MYTIKESMHNDDYWFFFSLLIGFLLLNIIYLFIYLLFTISTSHIDYWVKPTISSLGWYCRMSELSSTWHESAWRHTLEQWTWNLRVDALNQALAHEQIYIYVYFSYLWPSKHNMVPLQPVYNISNNNNKQILIKIIIFIIIRSK